MEKVDKSETIVADAPGLRQRSLGAVISLSQNPDNGEATAPSLFWGGRGGADAASV